MLGMAVVLQWPLTCTHHGTGLTGWYTGGRVIQVAFHSKCIVAICNLQDVAVSR